MPGEAISTRVGRLKAGSSNGPTIPTPKAWKDPRTFQRPGLSLNQAVGADHPELKPLEKAFAFVEGGSPLL